MSFMGEIEAGSRQWYAVRMKEPQNRGRRTVVIGGEFESYRGRGGTDRMRRIKGTGTRVFVPEHVLRRAGFDVFLPVRKDWRRVNRFSPERVLVTFPLLADWIFVGWGADEHRWHQLMDLDVVAGVLATGGHPIAIPERLVKRLMRQWGGGKLAPELYRYMKAGAEFDVGDLVRVTDGPFDGRELRVVGIDGPNVRAVLDFLGGAVPVDIGAEVLEVVR